MYIIEECRKLVIIIDLKGGKKCKVQREGPVSGLLGQKAKAFSEWSKAQQAKNENPWL